ncbi:hypothetical protein BLNAU_8666 [Blattamonas nauphoetae]|uniref:Right handed beta helix domain-containing protein n=1 Tax=Blattamonas nauphoetae TaxID=2049346 RepID=A0ABQ9XXW3_9EUKA|nr:hypothetical protein BLNAU_8666 [Blattamonas nauphoetae]
MQLILLSIISFLICAEEEIIPLRPFFQNVTSDIPTIKLQSGKYGGNWIRVKDYDRRIQSMSSDQNVTITVDADTAPLVEVSSAAFKLKAVSIIPSPNYVFIKANVTCTIVFDEVIHNYLESDAHVVLIDKGTVEFIANTFLATTKLHKSLLEISGSAAAGEYRTLRIIDTNIRSIRIESSDSLLATAYPIGKIEILNCSFVHISHVLPQTKDPLYECPDTVKIENTTFTNCTAPLGGGIVFGVFAENLSLEQVSITLCTATRSDALSIPSAKPWVWIENSNFSNCLTATAPFDGGVLWFPKPVKMTIKTSRFMNNSCSGNGGALGLAGGVNSLNIVNSQFISNTAARGGALFVGQNTTFVDSKFSFENVTFANRAKIGSDIAVEVMPRNLTENCFTNCSSRSGSPRIFDEATRKGYDWTNSS